MALSFVESKRLAAGKAASPANVSVDDIDVATLELNDEGQIAVYDDNGEETFERSGNYTWFADYSDDQWSYIDKNKDSAGCKSDQYHTGIQLAGYSV